MMFYRQPACRLTLAAALLSAASPLYATVFTLPQEGEALVGREERIIAGREDTLIEIGRQNSIGYDEILNANPGVDAWMPQNGSTVILPHVHILPDAPRQGIVINAAEMRLYYYPTTSSDRAGTVESYPISIGRSDWSTPLATTKISRKTANPIWYPTASVKKEHLANGDPLPDVVPAGPDNPLGKYALYLGLPAYLIHGTNNEYGIGMQVTHGCMRMYAPDIKRLYETVPVGTPVRIVNQPYKVGWREGVLYVEVHPWLEGTPEARANDTTILTQLVKLHLREYMDYPVDWEAVEQARIEANGLPTAVGPTMTPVALSQ
jgi:L,D-transpeptidase ErfK/SrfK